MLIGCNSSFFAVHSTASCEIQPNCVLNRVQHHQRRRAFFGIMRDQFVHFRLERGGRDEIALMLQRIRNRFCVRLNSKIIGRILPSQNQSSQGSPARR